MIGDVEMRSRALGAACLLALASTGCATNSYTQNGALVGGGLGAGTGAIIGHQSGHGEAGAIIGGALGALGGAIVGNNQDAWAQRDAALAELSARSQPMHPPLTNFDLIRMTQAGLGPEVIMNSVQARGGQFDLSPDGLIALKSSGVSEQVIQQVQVAGVGPAPIQQAGGAFPPPGQVVIVRPRPVVDVHLGPPPVHVDFGHPHYGHHYRRHHRSHSGVAFDWHHHF